MNLEIPDNIINKSTQIHKLERWIVSGKDDDGNHINSYIINVLRDARTDLGKAVADFLKEKV